MPKIGVTELNTMYERIEALCANRGVNITQMCREAGVPRGNLSELKMGRSSTLSSKTLSKLSAYFGVSMDYLLGTAEYSISADHNSVVLSGTIGDNHVNTPPAKQPKDLLAEDELEMLRIFRKLTFRQKHNLLNEMYRLEESLTSHPNNVHAPLDQTIGKAATKKQTKASSGSRGQGEPER